MNRVEKRREELLGKEFETNNCGKCFIIDYKGRQEVMVAFYEPFYILICALNKLKIGSVRNPLYPSAYGVGFCGVGNYNSHKDERLYDLWRGILRRAYSSEFHKKYPTYKYVTVCEEWLNFQNFAKWCEAQIGYSTVESNGLYYQLDKDILVKGNKVYSPETCCFVPSEVNNLIIFSNSARGEYPVGVTFHKRLKKYAANISLGGVQKHLGYFDEVLEAFNSYKIAKERYIKFVAEKYFGKIGENVYQKLINYSIDTMLMCEVIDEEQT